MATTRHSLLLRLRGENDPLSWETFHQLYEPFLQNVVRQCGIPDADAADIIQEVFITLLRSLPEFEYQAERGRFRGWLRTIVQHAVVDWHRRRGRRREVALDGRFAPSQFSSEEGWRMAHRRRVLEHALAVVRTQAQTTTWACFEEHVLKGRSAAEVARDLTLSCTAVYVNSSRVLKRIRRTCLRFDEVLGEELPAAGR
jgi:RNA polymerase sigma factor (sigma-70 family)